MTEKCSERGFIYRRGLSVLDGAMIALLIVVDVCVEVAGGLLIAVEIREEVEFAEGACVRAKD